MIGHSRRRTTVWLWLALFAAVAAPAADAAAPDWRALANPDRLEEAIDGCWLEGLRRSFKKDGGRAVGNQATYDCLVQLAIDEFDRNLATASYPTAEFADRLRQLVAEEAALYVDLGLAPLRCLPCSKIPGAAKGGRPVTVVDAYLHAIWAYYHGRALHDRR